MMEIAFHVLTYKVVDFKILSTHSSISGSDPVMEVKAVVHHKYLKGIILEEEMKIEEEGKNLRLKFIFSRKERSL